MAIIFDPTTKIVTLGSFNVSASEIWSRWVDWLALSDNSKYLPAFSQLGGIAPVALYIYLENSWRVRPQEADGQTTITGNLLVQGGGNPIVPTIGSFSSQVILEAPLAAQAIAVGSGSTVDVSGAINDIKDKTDQLVFTKTNELDVNIKSQNEAEVYGSGIDSDRWRGTQ